MPTKPNETNPPAEPPEARAPIETADTVTAAELTAGATMPPPNESAIAATAADNAAAQQPEGEAPTVFIDKTGRKYSKKPGRPAKIPPPETASMVAPDKPHAPAATAAPIIDRYDAAAELYCRTGYAVAGMIFQAPDEWQPGPGEHEALTPALAGYLRHLGVIDLPPGLAFAFAAAVYAAPRFVQPQTKKRTAELWAMLRRKTSLTPPQPSGGRSGEIAELTESFTVRATPVANTPP